MTFCTLLLQCHNSVIRPPVIAPPCLANSIIQIISDVWPGLPPKLCSDVAIICHYCTIITNYVFIAEQEVAIRAGIHWKNETNRLLHHRELVFVASKSRIDSIGEHQDDLDAPENNEENSHNVHNNILYWCILPIDWNCIPGHNTTTFIAWG